MAVSPDFWQPRRVRTMYFIGVTTAKSSIMQVFPRWSATWGLDAHLDGYDAPIHAPAEVYRAIVQHIQRDPLSLGALVTTHKIDLLAATRDLFDELDPNAELCGEISAICKRDGKLIGYALDPVSAGLAWGAFVPPGHFRRDQRSPQGSIQGGDQEPAVLCLGAGGAAIALSVYLARHPNIADRPSRFLAVDLNADRLDNLRRIHARLNSEVQVEYILNDNPARNDALLTALPPGSAVINATGLGKDRPGSPLTEAAVFPAGGVVWEMNYRGELTFLAQARRQATTRHLTIADGWVYFLHGWTQVISKVFEVPLTPAVFAALDQEASAFR
jgi:shikimate 5-dehydrogenase